MGFLSGLVNGMIKESTGYDVRKVTRLVGSKNLLMLGAGAALAGGVAGAMQNQGGAASGPSGSAVNWDAPRGPAPAAPPPPAVPAPPPAATPSALPSAAPAVPAPMPIPAAPTTSTPPPELPPVPQGASPIPSAQVAPPLPAMPTVDPVGVADDKAAETEPELPPELTFAIVRSMVAAAMADGNLDEREKKIVLDRLEESNLTMEQKQQVHRDLAIPPQPAELAAMTEDPEQREAMYRFAGLLVLADGDVDVLERSFLDRLASVFDFDTERKARLEAEIFA